MGANSDVLTRMGSILPRDWPTICERLFFVQLARGGARREIVEFRDFSTAALSLLQDLVTQL